MFQSTPASGRHQRQQRLEEVLEEVALLPNEICPLTGEVLTVLTGVSF
jgi:hypothetical protein